MPDILLANLTKDGWSSLHGRTIKAANTRSLVPFAKRLAVAYFETDSVFDRALNKMVAGLNSFYDVLYTSGTFLTDMQLHDLKQAVLVVGNHFTLLRALSKAAGSMDFQIVPKCHYFQHFAVQAELINPIIVQNYSEESFVGRIGRIWKSSANGPYAHTIEKTTWYKYIVSLVIRLNL